jgi:hypothetical protein
MSAQAGTGGAADHQAEVETDKPASSLRMVEFLGQATATVIYDEMPINDHSGPATTIRYWVRWTCVACRRLISSYCAAS